MDLEGQEVTDIHCFSFAPVKRHTRASLTKLFTAGGPTVMSVNPARRQGDLAASVAYRRMIRMLSELFGTRDTEAEVLRTRNRLATKYAEYVKLLFGDARIEGMALDDGLEPVPYEKFRRYSPAKTYRILRIEPLVKRLLESSLTFQELSDSFDEALLGAVRKRGFVGFKSVVAYRTGLDIGNPAEREARLSFGARRDGSEREWFGPKVKPLRDYLLSRTAALASRLRVFLQIHTGLGDTDVVAEKCSPLLLARFLKRDEVSKTPIILIHGGYPYTDEAAWMCSVFPNAHFELSTPFPPMYLPAVSRERFRRVLEVVPTSRVVYGSDSIETPEFHWLSAKLAKEALGGAVGDLVGEDVMDEDEGVRTAARVLDGNGKRLLGVG